MVQLSLWVLLLSCWVMRSEELPANLRIGETFEIQLAGNCEVSIELQEDRVYITEVYSRDVVWVGMVVASLSEEETIYDEYRTNLATHFISWDEAGTTPSIESIGWWMTNFVDDDLFEELPYGPVFECREVDVDDGLCEVNDYPKGPDIGIKTGTPKTMIVQRQGDEYYADQYQEATLEELDDGRLKHSYYRTYHDVFLDKIYLRLTAAREDTVDYSYMINILPYHGFSADNTAVTGFMDLLYDDPDVCENSLTNSPDAVMLTCTELSESVNGDCDAVSEYGYTMREMCECICPTDSDCIDTLSDIPGVPAMVDCDMVMGSVDSCEEVSWGFTVWEVCQLSCGYCDHELPETIVSTALETTASADSTPEWTGPCDNAIYSMDMPEYLTCDLFMETFESCSASTTISNMLVGELCAEYCGWCTPMNDDQADVESDGANRLAFLFCWLLPIILLSYV